MQRLPFATAAAYVPLHPSFPALQQAATACRACHLWENATQTVFGEGAVPAALMLIGEQPGDVEDRQGHPFIGPAGQLLDRALDDAGVQRSSVYVTNVVKHFKWEPRGKRRLHKKPNTTEILICRPWFEAELALVAPRVLVCMGASAAQALLGCRFRLTQHRGEFIDSKRWRRPALATIHPAAILRMPDRDTRHRELARFSADLAAAARFSRTLAA